MRCAVRGRRSAASLPKMLPIRKRLPHDVPLWVDPSKAHYFVTVGCKQRGKNQLARPRVADGIFETVKHRNVQGIWYARLVLLMPDHVHLMLSFPGTQSAFKPSSANGKNGLPSPCTLTGIAISLNIGFARRRACVRKRITFWPILCGPALSREQRIGHTFSLRNHGRDSALRCPDTAARRPYHSGLAVTSHGLLQLFSMAFAKKSPTATVSK